MPIGDADMNLGRCVFATKMCVEFEHGRGSDNDNDKKSVVVPSHTEKADCACIVPDLY